MKLLALVLAILALFIMSVAVGMASEGNILAGAIIALLAVISGCFALECIKSGTGEGKRYEKPKIGLGINRGKIHDTLD